MSVPGALQLGPVAYAFCLFVVSSVAIPLLFLLSRCVMLGVTCSLGWGRGAFGRLVWKEERAVPLHYHYYPASIWVCHVTGF